MFYLSALVKLDLLTGLLRVKIGNINNLMITILVADNTNNEIFDKTLS